MEGKKMREVRIWYEKSTYYDRATFVLAEQGRIGEQRAKEAPLTHYEFKQLPRDTLGLWDQARYMKHVTELCQMIPRET